ncbi:MAG: type IV toxin-antitoxin system AbiEi family antitoxin domain-containing protein [Pleurocapsa sp. MO_192.B19]|nr:type IV toxin-antitoxin system AbiEi family antitoxin domain-containing protein [Pleurocapsa sp. MO_192.B19]
MTDNRFLMTAVEISKILGVSDRTISRWARKGKVVKEARGKYCLVSVFNCYRELLLEEIERTQESINIARNSAVKKSLQQEKIEASIKIITSNAKIKEHELSVMQLNLVNREDAERVYREACREFTNLAHQLPFDVADDIFQLDDPNEIKNLLEIKINELLNTLSIESCV